MPNEPPGIEIITGRKARYSAEHKLQLVEEAVQPGMTVSVSRPPAWHLAEPAVQVEAPNFRGGERTAVKADAGAVGSSRCVNSKECLLSRCRLRCAAPRLNHRHRVAKSRSKKLHIRPKADETIAHGYPLSRGIWCCDWTPTGLAMCLARLDDAIYGLAEAWMLVLARNTK